MKLWTVAPLDKNEAQEIQTKYGLSGIIAMLLQIRNIKTKEEIEDFLYNDSYIASPFEITACTVGAEIISSSSHIETV